MIHISYEEIHTLNNSGVDTDIWGPWPNFGAPFQFYEFFDTVTFDENLENIKKYSKFKY